jgi:DHA1 family multidrug resistance protein-like MFS transporter
VRSHTGSPQGSLAAASAVGFLYWTGWQATTPFLALYAVALGAGPAAVGAVLGGYSVLALLASVPAGVLAERVGSGRMMLAGCVLGSASFLVIVCGGGLGALIGGLTLLGVSQVTVSIGTQVEAIVGRAHKDLARAITQYFFFSSASQVMGPALGGILVRDARYPAAFLGAAALSALGALAAVAPARRPPVRDAVVARPPAVETIAATLGEKPAARAALLVSLTAELTLASWSAFLPLLLAARGHGSGAVAFLFGVRAVANTGVRLLMGRITQRFSRARVLMLGLLLGAASLAGMAAFSSLAIVGAAVVVFGLATGLYTTLAAIAVASGFPPQAAGVGVGMRMLASRIGLIVGPILTGLVAQSLGLAVAMGTNALLCGAAALLYLRRPRVSAIRAARAGSA